MIRKSMPSGYDPMGGHRFSEKDHAQTKRAGSAARCKESAMSAINPLTALAVVLATAATDAVYVMFTSAVVARKRVPAATWSSIWYLLSSFAVISYTENWIYVGFAAIGSWIGAYASMTFLHRPPGGPPVGAAPE
jgi:hypothetical protein